MSILLEYKQQQKLYKKVIKACQHLLHSHKNARKARQYLNKRLHKYDQLNYQFGYFPSNESLNILTSLVKKEDLESLNLLYQKFHEDISYGHFSEHNLVLPFYNVHGEVIAIVGRCLLSEEERQESRLNKYKYSVGCQKDLYVWGLNKAKEAIIERNFVLGVEGQFDCIALHASGIENTVAFGGANLSRFQMFQIRRYTNNIVLMYDNDEAGQKAKNKVKERYKKEANIKVVSPPDGFKDIDEFFHKSDNQDYKNYVIERIKSFGE